MFLSLRQKIPLQRPRSPAVEQPKNRCRSRLRLFRRRGVNEELPGIATELASKQHVLIAFGRVEKCRELIWPMPFRAPRGKHLKEYIQRFVSVSVDLHQLPHFDGKFSARAWIDAAKVQFMFMEWHHDQLGHEFSLKQLWIGPKQLCLLCRPRFHFIVSLGRPAQL